MSEKPPASNGPWYDEYKQTRISRALDLLRVARCPDYRCVDGITTKTGADRTRCNFCAARDEVLGDE